MSEDHFPPDHEWNNIYLSEPTEGQLCMSKADGKDGYVGECAYHNGYFETYEIHSNRVIITRWKHDLWLPLQRTT